MNQQNEAGDEELTASCEEGVERRKWARRSALWWRRPEMDPSLGVKTWRGECRR
jgi:hypothetical protein